MELVRRTSGDASGGVAPSRRKATSFRRTANLFHCPQNSLFGDISALLQVNRCGRPLRELLLAQELHPRLVNGSDYPLPAIDPLVSTRVLVDRGYITEEDRTLCNAVYDANPLLFDFVTKRAVRVVQNGRAYGFSPRVFETAWLFERA